MQQESKNKTHIYAVNAQQFIDNQWENITILIYSHNTDIAKNHITVYQQQNQLRISYTFLPLPFETYLKRHGDEAFIEPLKALVQELSENNPIIIFNPNQHNKNEKSATPSLTKHEFLLRMENEHSSFIFQPIPASIKPHLWPKDSESQCYAIINAAVSFWFPSRFELEDLHSECLFKGEEAEKRKKVAPYLLHLPENHPFVEELCSNASVEEKGGFQQWNKNFGFFFCSSADFDTLLHHFRKFIYMNTYDDRLLYFRFYDPLVLENYFDFLQHYPRKLSTFWGNGLIDKFILPKKQNAICYTPNVDFSKIKPAKKLLDKFEMDEMIAKNDEKLLLHLVQDIIKNVPNVLDYYSQDLIEQAVRHCNNIAGLYHLKETRTVGLLTLYSLACGHVIDILDPEKQIIKILQTNLSEMEKLSLIQDRINKLEQKGIIHNKFGEHHE
ncbi:DUF4123 domain-containing protein [Aggregatibacter actinomycetemcomitans]|uniref:DUF4123 domain-containing protein n=1 Tax=Aggregatibacter actinomycetemcomitans TaxID=714 RepID=UPI00197C8494|nr:DUF4123 domain-containing protein [Aggregatibacter actinomycetemcomitans]MBN6069962.1 DUF4123 domain-containing protein [Aggregatibacter actinomycetemcomitans]